MSGENVTNGQSKDMETTPTKESNGAGPAEADSLILTPEQRLVEDADVEAKGYKKAADYWQSVDPTVDGMLGGFGKISAIDIDGSKKFLKFLFKVSILNDKS